MSLFTALFMIAFWFVGGLLGLQFESILLISIMIVALGDVDE